MNVEVDQRKHGDKLEPIPIALSKELSKGAEAWASEPAWATMESNFQAI